MAVYKVPQDVEADDKLIGPLTFRQFVFVIIMIGFIYAAYVLLTINFVLVVIPLPFIIFFAALGFPWRKDQPTEVYLTALIHFWTKPRKRIWNQEGHVEHVHITVPKREEHHYTDGLSNTEVRSRLHSLANTLDTRGWASKNTTEPSVSGQDIAAAQQASFESDRLVMPRVTTPPPNPAMDVSNKDDVMDVQNNPVAQNFDALVNRAAEERRAELLQQVKQAELSADATVSETPTYNPYPEMRQNVLNPASALPPDNNSPTPPITQEAQNAILNLANNSDLNVSTIARQADQAMESGDTIELH